MNSLPSPAALKTYLVLVTLLSSGCVSYEPVALVPAETATQFEARRLDDRALEHFITGQIADSGHKWPLPSWDIDSLTLAALYFHPDLKVARAQWAAAAAGETTAAEHPNPVFALAPAYNTSNSDPSPWVVSTLLDFPLETGGKRKLRMSQAALNAEIARLNLTTTAWQIRSQLKLSLLNLFATQERETLLVQQAALEREILQLLELQYRSGDISSFELTQARIMSNTVSLSRLDASRQNVEANVQLAAAIGVSTQALAGVNLSFDSLHELPADIPDADSRRQALTRRADILSALAAYAISQSALQLEIARQYPDISLGPGYEYDQSDNKWLLGLSLTLPLFNQNQGAIAQARARREEAAARFNALQARVMSQLDSALAGYRAALAIQSETDAMLSELSRQQERARAMLQTGEISKSEHLGMTLQFNAVAQARLAAWISAQQAAAKLEDALQSPMNLPSLTGSDPGSERSEIAGDQP